MAEEDINFDLTAKKKKKKKKTPFDPDGMEAPEVRVMLKIMDLRIQLCNILISMLLRMKANNLQPQVRRQNQSKRRKKKRRLSLRMEMTLT